MFGDIAADKSLEPAFRALALAVPSESRLRVKSAKTSTPARSMPHAAIFLQRLP
jgi:hypothetical protein